MFLKELFINEGYKEARAEFSKNVDDELVDGNIIDFRRLVDRNQITGDEKNIDYWRKQGFEKFRKFVHSKKDIPSKTQIKRKSVDGESDIYRDDDQWLIVHPKDKLASCYFGKYTHWCISKPHQNYFEKYQEKRSKFIFFFKNADLADGYAILVPTSGRTPSTPGYDVTYDEITYVNFKDNDITEDEFISQTGIDPKVYIDKLLPSKNQENPKYKKFINDYKNAIENYDVSKIHYLYRIAYNSYEIKPLLKDLYEYALSKNPTKELGNVLVAISEYDRDRRLQSLLLKCSISSSVRYAAMHKTERWVEFEHAVEMLAFDDFKKLNIDDLCTYIKLAVHGDRWKGIEKYLHKFPILDKTYTKYCYDIHSNSKDNDDAEIDFYSSQE